MSTPNNQKKSFNRPKSAEPGSPLLRRALSPDRLHPRSAENKTSISPLANTVVKVNPRVTIAQTSNTDATEDVSDVTKESNESKTDKKAASEQKVTADYSKLTHGISINIGNVMSNSCGSTQLPRIAEEKDSPTGTKNDDYNTKVDEICENKLKDEIASNEKVQESLKDDEEKNSKELPDKEVAANKSETIKEISTNSDKSAACSSTSSVFNKNFIETSPECRKILKRYKFEGLTFGLTSHDKMKQESGENKKNK